MTSSAAQLKSDHMSSHGANHSRKIFDIKRFMLAELFPNIAATFSVGMVEPKFEKEIQSTFFI